MSFLLSNRLDPTASFRQELPESGCHGWQKQ